MSCGHNPSVFISESVNPNIWCPMTDSECRNDCAWAVTIGAPDQHKICAVVLNSCNLNYIEAYLRK